MTKLKKQFLISGIVLAAALILFLSWFLISRHNEHTALIDEASVNLTEEEKAELPGFFKWLFGREKIQKALASSETLRDEHGVSVKNDRHFMVDPVEVDDIKTIHVHNPGDDYTLIHKNSGAWAFEGASGYDLDQEKLSLLRTNTRYLLSTQYVETADLADLSKYGIDVDNPLVWFEVEHKDGSYKVLVGDKTPDDSGYYAVLSGRDALYVLDTGLEESVFLCVEDYINPVIQKETPSGQTAVKDVFIDKDGETFLKIEMVSDSFTYGNNSTHRVTYPVINHATSLGNFGTIFSQQITALNCQETLFYGADITEEKLGELGFYKDGELYADFKLEVTFTDSQYNVTLYLVKADDGYIVYSEEYNIIVKASEDSFSFLEWELISWISAEVYMLDIADVASVEFTSPTSHALFELWGDEGVQVKCNGEIIPSADFKTVYKELMYLFITDWGERPESYSELMSLRVTMESGEVLDYKFISATPVNSFYTLNGNDRFYVERSTLLELRGKFEALIPEAS